MRALIETKIEQMLQENMTQEEKKKVKLAAKSLLHRLLEEHPKVMANRITELPKQDRPREKIHSKGAGVLSDEELVAVLIRN